MKGLCDFVTMRIEDRIYDFSLPLDYDASYTPYIVGFILFVFSWLLLDELLKIKRKKDNENVLLDTTSNESNKQSSNFVVSFLGRLIGFIKVFSLFCSIVFICVLILE